MKRGLGHIEMIIAFLLFISFLMFGLYFFNPLDSDRVLSSTLEYAADEIKSNVTTQLLVYGIVLKQGLPQEVSFTLSRENTPGNGVRVESPATNVLASDYSGNTIRIDRDSERLVFVKFGVFSPQGTIIPSPQAIAINTDYNVSSSDKREVISEQLFLDLMAYYSSHYGGIKQQFNLPQRVEFAFSLRFNDIEVIGVERSPPEGVEVFAMSKRYEVIRTDGKSTFADLNVEVW